VADDLLVGVPDDRHWTGGAVLRIPWTLIDKINNPEHHAGTVLTRSGGARFGTALG
jgi:hypothetical protein